MVMVSKLVLGFMLLGGVKALNSDSLLAPCGRYKCDRTTEYCYQSIDGDETTKSCLSCERNCGDIQMDGNPDHKDLCLNLCAFRFGMLHRQDMTIPYTAVTNSGSIIIAETSAAADLYKILFGCILVVWLITCIAWWLDHNGYFKTWWKNCIKREVKENQNPLLSEQSTVISMTESGPHQPMTDDLGLSSQPSETQFNFRTDGDIPQEIEPTTQSPVQETDNSSSGVPQSDAHRLYGPTSVRG